MRLLQAVVVIGLVGVWVWVLGRPLLSSMLNRAHRDPVGHFNRHMAVLGDAPRRSAGVSGRALGYGAPARNSWLAQPAYKRRLQLMMGLGLAAVVSALLAIVFRGIFVSQFALLTVLLLAYIALAAVAGGRQVERGQKVTQLGQGQPSQPDRVRAVGDR